MFEKNTMKVKYAVQVLSKSVANALQTMFDLKVPKFENVHATVEFLNMFDTVFDIMNSRKLNQKYCKAPLSHQNELEWKTMFSKCESYICNLKTKTGKNVLHSQRYASFLGINISTL
jgi:elongation factor P--beta-lysine ligase